MKAWLAGALTVLVVAGCGKDARMKGGNELNAAGLTTALDALSRKRLYFAHQSVGSNILDGVRTILDEMPGTGLRVVETRDPSMLGGPVFAHSPIGGNGSPDGKIEEFRSVVESGVGDRVDVAMLKLCFLDVTAATDVPSLFAHYRRVMADLRRRYPGETFVHVTVPLTSLQVGPKAWVKRILGKPIRGLHDNAKRAEYNDLLRREYAGREPVFDLAGIEATHPESGESSVTVNGMPVPALSPGYTEDGGHLNESGRRRVAGKLLLFLGSLP